MVHDWRFLDSLRRRARGRETLGMSLGPAPERAQHPVALPQATVCHRNHRPRTPVAPSTRSILHRPHGDRATHRDTMVVTVISWRREHEFYTAGREAGRWLTQRDVSESGDVTSTTVRTHHETLSELAVWTGHVGSEGVPFSQRIASTAAGNCCSRSLRGRRVDARRETPRYAGRQACLRD